VVKSWGGRLVLVYLPTWSRIADPSWDGPGHDRLLNLFRDNGLEVVDATAAFRENADPLGLFTFRLHGHYTGTGYGVVAELMGGVLTESGSVP